MSHIPYDGWAWADLCMYMNACKTFSKPIPRIECNYPFCLNKNRLENIPKRVFHSIYSHSNEMQRITKRLITLNMMKDRNVCIEKLKTKNKWAMSRTSVKTFWLSRWFFFWFCVFMYLCGYSRYNNSHRWSLRSIGTQYLLTKWTNNVWDTATHSNLYQKPQNWRTKLTPFIYP